MTVTVYRGTHQIGGCVTEYRTKTTRILVDLGIPLPGAPHQEPIRLPGVTEPPVFDRGRGNQGAPHRGFSNPRS